MIKIEGWSMNDEEKGWKMVKNKEWRFMDERKYMRFWVDMSEVVLTLSSEVVGFKDDNSEVDFK